MRRPLAQTSVRDALDSAVIALTAAGVDTPRLDAELLLAAAMGVDRAAIVADPGRGDRAGRGAPLHGARRAPARARAGRLHPRHEGVPRRSSWRSTRAC